jgi:diguanylate cyclase (GGDEF)-like protein
MSAYHLNILDETVLSGYTGPVPSQSHWLATPDNIQSLHIGAALQTSLDVTEILKIFSRELKSTIPHDGFGFRSDEQDIDFHSGIPENHRFECQLNLMGNCLGEFVLYRTQEFSEPELMELEGLVCTLLYPLTKALRYQQAVNASLKDSLTGLNNRLSLNENLEREIQLAHRRESSLALLALDLDHFKNINDSYGHSSGDEVLKCVAGKIQETLRSCDQVFRYGGEEFVILLADTDKAGAELVAERIRSGITDCKCGETGIQVTVSLGIAFLQKNDTATQLFDKADKALYKAKDSGRNRFELYQSQGASE